MDNDKMDAETETPHATETSTLISNPIFDVHPVESLTEPTSKPAKDGISNEGPSQTPGTRISTAAPMDGLIRSDSLGVLLQPTPQAFETMPASTSAPSQTSQRLLAAYRDVDTQNDAPLDRPLNVTDALSYLDAVKMQFQDQPDVYNHFLDIMKDFKSQLIDTPGVIKRVSYLFNGRASLIQGFNTFLPVGYRIECSSDAHDANFITVTTPTGTMMQTTNNGPGNGPILWSTSPHVSLETLLSKDTGAFGPDPVSDNPIRPSLSPDPSFYAVDGQTIEPAVQYVQKIKQRCDPETYKQFLEILSRYHHKPDTIDEREVSAQISQLFKDAPDLRSDFRIFMPEKSQHIFDDSDDNMLTTSLDARRTDTPNIEGRSSRRKLEPSLSSSTNGVVNFTSVGSALPQKRKRKAVEKEKDNGKVASSNKLKKTKQQHAASSTDLASRNIAGPSSPRRSMHAAPIQPSRSSQAVPVFAPQDETHFFDRVKRALDNRDTYNEFLKLVNLFTQNYIDTARLLKDSWNFLGNGELMGQFKEILGWDEMKERESWILEQQQQHGWSRPSLGSVLDRPTRADLNVKYGSYRRLPASEINVICSGRDEMCRSVLNDEWVSHPTWSSEDSGFLVQKKNVYEEALHRSEEERHEYDFHIEAIARTILMLEPINNKIAQLSIEERGSFKLKPNLGGSGKSIHQRVIKKIYGRDAGLEVVQAMQESPALAIPVVLTRLKQKEEAWKRAQREWNKVWREVDARNYQKSLDHQGITFKTADKKAITSKAFVSQIEAAREEQVAQRASLIDPLFARTRPRHQLELVMDDVQILQDALKLTLSFLDRTQAQINFADRKRIEAFLRSFVPLFFVLDPISFNSTFMTAQETAHSDISDDVGSVGDDAEASSVVGSSRTGRSHRKGGGASSGGDLRKKLLKSEQAKSSSRKTRGQEASPSISRLASPVLPDAMEVDGEAGHDEPPPQTDGPSPSKRTCRKNIFFSNTVFYTLLRLLELLYARLALFKGISARLASENFSRPHPIANDLGLPSLADVTNGDSPPKEQFYDLLLESCERLFENEVEQQVFEDQMRYMFGTKHAYKIFTIDKLIGALIKQVQAVITDAKSQDLLEILKRERSMTSPTTQDQINGRRNAEKVLGPDENLFRIDWLPDSKTLTVQLIGKDDSSFDDSEVLTGRWQAYIDSFVSSEHTRGVLASRVRKPFLRKNLSPASDGGQPRIIARGDLEIKVCVRTYRLFFVSKTEDFLRRISSLEDIEQTSQRLRSRTSQRMKWMERAEAGSLFSLS